MTATATANTAPVRLDLVVPDVIPALIKVREAVGGHGLDIKLHHLVHLRASQINGCAFCVKMHTREARQDGETSDRLDRLVVWAHVSDFSEAEKAALAWTEALTVLNPQTDYASLRGRLRASFTDKQIGALTATVGMINLWNRLQVSAH
ncbi:MULTISPECIES: carboxymuconolactone decarboxylase family protein [unclassified Polaromonas]|jgi:AhpD family alkylhydroperoxidase|uniref:carboxymuconolactone decarboxylase family protein n=1 Tax=unclassified Polaromonas TaxID=2638319 RepID=UPI000BCB47A5|nr:MULTISPECIES: carboxymuconolactone decarboxylase family protein [unclassified Polaromonas]OYY33771.1 MAG: alkylhydroperoxidase [Polaromonas sp. 35-63-35]OYZ19433.1 MAG: alkylhydroperoxidase [Polaromonas sp. 16-63-31]OYZ77344.1 MAG: alkylhydroperoxidase [Polaromonas sp. 24-63-21]OZA48354.1 MAG: alkylhydroperoxidase [Polaromonas sp. 17-63-33]OZA86621.1 MAG: alkylhydroperoxidase [Polaromonas sp. 39-63-25]